MTQQFILRFDNASVADQNRFADDLLNALMDAHPEVTADRKRENIAAQDFGGTLVLVLGTPAIVAVAHALKNWLSRNNAASVSIETPTGRLVAKNLESRDVTAIIKALSTTETQ